MPVTVLMPICSNSTDCTAGRAHRRMSLFSHKQPSWWPCYQPSAVQGQP